MTDYIDLRLRRWLEKLQNEGAIEAVEQEINNRIEPYPRMQAALGVRPINILEVAAAARCCTLMAGPHPMMNFERFIGNKKQAQAAVNSLVHQLEQPHPEIVTVIDKFVEQAGYAGYQNADGSDDKSGAARFASLILTCAYPNRFVDYPSAVSWKNFSKELGAKTLESRASYGQQLIWAAEIAKAVTQTPTFQRQWSDTRYRYPLWVVSGLNWIYKREH
jgi:hypothetical protein